MLGLICATFVPFPEKTVQLLPHEISVTSLKLHHLPDLKLFDWNEQ